MNKCLSWFKKHLFQDPINSFITVVLAFFGLKAVISLLNWAVFRSTWIGAAADLSQRRRCLLGIYWRKNNIYPLSVTIRRSTDGGLSFS